MLTLLGIIGMLALFWCAANLAWACGAVLGFRSSDKTLGVICLVLIVVLAMCLAPLLWVIYF